MNVQFARLPSRALLRISGADSAAFLQGLLTNDIAHVRPGHPAFAALLSAQGKLQYEFLVWARDEATFLLDCETTHKDELRKRLALYRLRAKVEIDEAGEAVFAAWGGDLAHPLAERPEGAAFDPRLRDLGIRQTGPEATRAAWATLGWNESDESAYTAHRHGLGVPEGRAELGYERLYALEANLEELKGVSFKKGCYVGQELTARMKHKTDLKKRLLPIALDGSTAPGTGLTADGREIGQVIGAAGSWGTALVRLDRLSGVLEGDYDLTAGSAHAHINWPAAYLTPPER